MSNKINKKQNEKQRYKIIVNNDIIGYNQISQLLNNAHEENRKAGLIYGSGFTTSETLKKKVESGESLCLIAINENNELLGTGFLSFISPSYWFCKGENVAYFELLAINPLFQSKGIGGEIADTIIDIATERKYKIILAISAEKNIAIKNMLLNQGFKKVKYGAGTSNNFYSVFYAKWIGECPYSNFYIWCRYIIDKWLHVLLVKPGGERRFL